METERKYNGYPFTTFTDSFRLSWDEYYRVFVQLILVVLPDGPPNTRGPLEVLVGLFTDFSDFLGRLLVIVEFYSRDYLCTYMFFFQKSSSGGVR